MNLPKKKAVFLDRDGVINVDRCYVHCRDDFHFQDGIFELCRAAQTLGYLLVVVTNQAGIARGYYSEADFLELTEWMIRSFAEQQIDIARVYYCPYHPVHGVGRYKCNSPDRKPNPGMILRAKDELNLDLKSSILIGDKLSDIYAAEAAGVGRKVLLRAGTGAIKMQGVQCYVSRSLEDIRYRLFSPLHCDTGRCVSIV
ncbi:MAG: D-glycero-beta-D-manno-heptose 1,7-bisphosphate 7-phosphatase [Terriglobia bacterium]